jgi:hypothetical protein
MSRYFFTLHMIDETVVAESDGIEFKDLAEARQEAIEAVVTMVLEGRIKRERPAIKTVEISDQSGEIVSLIPFEGPRSH